MMLPCKTKIPGRSAQGPKVVLGPGTGLGQAQLFWDEVQGGYKVWPSEGSHSCFAPRGWKQRALQARSFPLLRCCAPSMICVF